ncbi:MAG: transglycosylase domain-containing protein [Smithella sp.]|nr:transglycosylase domain-containing protein [Smithella sp.]
MYTMVIGSALIFTGLYHVYFDRSALPDIEPLIRFEFPTIGHVYDINDQPIIELAREYRRNIGYKDIPPIVRDAIIATEDKNFFRHNGVDYSALPRVLSKIRIGSLARKITGIRWNNEDNRPAVLPQGGSTITQQLARGYFLKDLMAFQYKTNQENGNHLRQGISLPRVLSYIIDSRSINMLVRKMEEIRLSLWIEKKMRERFGSKRRAKEEILARYASLIYMGNGQYGFAAAAEYYYGRPLKTFTVDDAEKAVVLAGIAKAPSYYAPSARNTERVLRRRNQNMALMASNGFISVESAQSAEKKTIPVAVRIKTKTSLGPAVVRNVLDDLKGFRADLGIEDLLQGRIQIYSTVDGRVQQIVNEALEHGLERYEKRHPRFRGLIQGSVIVLRNRDAGILAESGGRQFYQGRLASYSDFNRVTQSVRQPGSAMKPLVYLAAFQHGKFNLDTLVPDRPIGVRDSGEQSTKWISNYDNEFQGVIPLRKALAESRNAVAVWVSQRIGIDSILQVSRSVGIQTPLKPYPSTALGASEVNLMELANAYRTIASGIMAQPHVIRRIVLASGEELAEKEPSGVPVNIDDEVLFLIQEGLRGVVRIPGGTAHSLDANWFPIPVMGKTGTTNEFRDALFVGSTYGPEGITVAVRIGFDDNRSLGRKETGNRVALPVFKEIMLRVYREKILGPAPVFPDRMEKNINNYLRSRLVEVEDDPVPESEIPEVNI